MGAEGPHLKNPFLSCSSKKQRENKQPKIKRESAKPFDYKTIFK